MTKVVVDNLSKKIKNFWIDGVNFKVHSGEIFAIVGTEDSGKELLVKTMQRLGFLTAGKVDVNRKDTGTLVGDQNFYPNQSIWSTVKMMAKLYDKDVTRTQMKNTLNLLGLYKKRKAKIKTLSHNRITRLKIACAIIGNPGILILDRPFMNLDEYEARIVRVALKTLADKFDTAVILTAPDFCGIEEIFDTVAIIDAGEIVLVESYNNLARSVAKFSKTCVTTEAPHLAATKIKEKFQYVTHIHGTNDVVVDTHPDNAQAIFEYLKEENIPVDYVTRVNKSIADLFYALKNQRPVATPAEVPV